MTETSIKTSKNQNSVLISRTIFITFILTIITLSVMFVLYKSQMLKQKEINPSDKNQIYFLGEQLDY